ncbi:MAG TPA: hypothetical protein VMX76_03165 [Nevskiaceae bacterium]|nr:hypothetical protein [Nevskiaceae bacterium]
MDIERRKETDIFRKIDFLRSRKLPDRAIRPLARAGGKWLDPEYLARASDEEILALRNLGKTRLSEIREFLVRWKAESDLGAEQTVSTGLKPPANREEVLDPGENLVAGGKWINPEYLARTSDEEAGEEIFAIRNIGEATLAEIREFLVRWKAESDFEAEQIVGGLFKPFATYEVLGLEENFLEKEFVLKDLRRGIVSFERFHSVEIELYKSYMRKKGKKVVAPYDLAFFTPCQLEVSLSLLSESDLPFGVLNFPSRHQWFIGLPYGEEEEGNVWYIWFDVEQKECTFLLPNRKEVLQELTIGFF